jgi:hypothetical protein
MREETLIIRPHAHFSGLAVTALVPLTQHQALHSAYLRLQAEHLKLEAAFKEANDYDNRARDALIELKSNGSKLSAETIRAMAAEVWRERRRRTLHYRVWREASRAWRRLKRQ